LQLRTGTCKRKRRKGITMPSMYVLVDKRDGSIAFETIAKPSGRVKQFAGEFGEVMATVGAMRAEIRPGAACPLEIRSLADASNYLKTVAERLKRMALGAEASNPRSVMAAAFRRQARTLRDGAQEFAKLSPAKRKKLLETARCLDPLARI
jgi:hypothetical protein